MKPQVQLAGIRERYMPGIFSYAADGNPAIVTGGGAGPAADRGQAAPLPPAQSPGHDLPLAGEVGPAASRRESHDVGRKFS